MPTKVTPSRLDSTKDFSSLVPSAYDKANSGASFANGAFVTANSAASFANGAFLTANSAASFANGAFDRANSAYAQANTDTTNISITAGTYGNSTSVPVITLAANGRITAVSNATISGGGGGGGASVTVGATAPAGAANGYLWYDDTSTGELFVYSSGTWVTTSIMPSTSADAPSISGPTQANEATTQTFTISNYNGAYTYIIAVTGGSVTRTAQNIYWTMPSVTTNTTHYMTTQVVNAGTTTAVDTRTVLVVDLGISDAAIIISDFTSYTLSLGWY